MIQKIDRYWQTLRHLKLIQIYGRVWFRLSRPKPNLAPAPSVRVPNGMWQLPAGRDPSMTGAGEFSFLGVSGALSAVGWDGPEHDKLWRYNQHYFDDLNAHNSADRAKWHRALLEDWLGTNTIGAGNGWEPYPTSLRIVNWIKWGLSGNPLSPDCVHSLAIQARWLTQRLEIHLLGNHLFANAKALVFAGLYFEGVEARQWLEKGLSILEREVPEQILKDGGHFELSPMYHALALEDFLDLHNVFKAYSDALTTRWIKQVDSWSGRVAEMRYWMHATAHPDGKISFFNDAAFDIAPQISELDDYADRLGFETNKVCDDLVWLKESGYARLAKGDAVALLDMAEVGPNYLPGHGHADTLSFEFSLFGQRILVNAGTSCYGTSSERLRQRGTQAHNTVTVDARDSSEVWSGFRVARRAHPITPEVHEGEALSARCAHDGYRRLRGRPVHERAWQLSHRQLSVSDVLSDRSQGAVARFHFHPHVVLEEGAMAREGKGILPNNKTFLWEVIEGKGHIEPASWHPYFGANIPNSCLVVQLDRGRSHLKIRWV